MNCPYRIIRALVTACVSLLKLKKSSEIEEFARQKVTGYIYFNIFLRKAQ